VSEYELRRAGTIEQYIVKRGLKSGGIERYYVSISYYQTGELAEIKIDDTVIPPTYLDVIGFLEKEGLLKRGLRSE